ncbi:MAG: hypothetical protein ACOY9Y_11790 [Bacillota bacterium]
MRLIAWYASRPFFMNTPQVVSRCPKCGNQAVRLKENSGRYFFWCNSCLWLRKALVFGW